MNELTTIEELEKALEGDGEVFLYKHSTACPTSAWANLRLGEYLEDPPDAIPPFYMIKVIQSRPVSNAIAERFGVEHQSPQLLLVKNGQAVWDTSHNNITAEAIGEALAAHADAG